MSKNKGGGYKTFAHTGNIPPVSVRVHTPKRQQTTLFVGKQPGPSRRVLCEVMCGLSIESYERIYSWFKDVRCVAERGLLLGDFFQARIRLAQHLTRTPFTKEEEIWQENFSYRFSIGMKLYPPFMFYSLHETNRALAFKLHSHDKTVEFLFKNHRACLKEMGYEEVPFELRCVKWRQNGVRRSTVYDMHELQHVLLAINTELKYSPLSFAPIGIRFKAQKLHF